MENDLESHNRKIQVIVDKLVLARWLESATVVDAGLSNRGKVKVRLTKYGFQMLSRFKEVHDLLGHFDDPERHELYDILIGWIQQSPDRFDIDIEPPNQT